MFSHLLLSFLEKTGLCVHDVCPALPPETISAQFFRMRRGGGLLAMLTSAWLGAGALYTLEPPMFHPDFPPTISYLAAKFEFASSIDDGTNAATASLEPRARNDEQTAQLLFGMETEPVSAGELHEKWDHVEALIAQDFAAVDQCRANGSCSVAARRLIDISGKGTGRNRRALVGLINRAVNLAISPVSDEKQWGVADHWSDPFETLLSLRGDCEDYAILKYAALLEAGVPKNDVKIVILKTFFPNETHAAVAARIDNQWLILDNRTLSLVLDTDVSRAIPEFVLDYEGVKRFNWASRNRGIAS